MPHPNHRDPRSIALLQTLVHAALLVAAGTVAAQSAPAPAASAPSTTIESVTIKGQAMRGAGGAYSTTTLDAEQIRDEGTTQPEQLLRRVPGVEVRGYHLGGVVNVITIRGFSGGAHGGDLGMVIDGIPLNESMSHADGYSDLNVIVPLEIDSFDVFRGPVSALYGNFNRGGVIAINSRRGGNYRQFDASLGSFSTADVQAAVGMKLGDGQFNGAAQFDRTGDFRPESKFTRGTLSGRYSLDLAATTQLSISGRAHKSDWDSVGYLSRSQFEGGDPYGKDPRENHDGGSKSFYTGRVDLNHTFSDSLKLLTFAYGTHQDYTRFFSRPLSAAVYSQREETYQRAVGGAGFSLNGRAAPGGIAVNYVAGAEVYRESTDYLFFEGTVGQRRVGPAGYDREYTFNSSSAFGEAEVLVRPWFRPTLGLRYDRFTGDCTRNGSETGTDPCAALNTAHRVTPKLGVRSTVAAGLDLRASVAEGFALPPGVAKYAAGGAGLAPTVFRQTEVGVSYRQGIFRGDLAAYRITSSNEVRTVSPGVYENFGRTRRTGVELTAALLPIDDLEISVTGNTADARVTENSNAAIVGKQVTGVPRKSATVAAAYRPELGFGASAEVHRVGNSAADAANTFVYGRFTTLDLGAEYRGRWGGNRYRAYAKVANATDRVYASNAFIIGGQQLVAPDAPRSFRIGVQSDF